MCYSPSFRKTGFHLTVKGWKWAFRVFDSLSNLKRRVWENWVLNKADGLQLRKQKPVHQPGSPVSCILWFAVTVIHKWRCIEEAQEGGLPVCYALAVVCGVVVLVSTLIGNGTKQ